MFQKGTPVGGIQPYFLTQAVSDLDRTKQLADQPEIATITAQALEVASVLADFIRGATSTIDIAIYDFRLLDGPLTATIVDAVKEAVGKGATVRLAFDINNQDPTLKAFADAGGDPAPRGTHLFVDNAALPAEVQVKAIQEEAIDPGHQIMHQKYIVRDADTDHGAVLMGSANFTTDAWGIQDNNILVVADAPELATRYEKDFSELWDAEAITGTGADAGGPATVGALDIESAFAPAGGSDIEAALAALIASATTRLRVASMVITSPDILQALAERIDAGVELVGVYDGPEMRNTVAAWKRSGSAASQEHLALWQKVSARLVEKASVPFSANGPHNFMHDKVVVADDRVATGSFNFSRNAARNAENVLQIPHAGLAQQYTDYIDGLVTRYGSPVAVGLH